MPIYEYRCSACGFQKTTSKNERRPLTTCPPAVPRPIQAAVGRRLPAEGQRLVRHRLQGRQRLQPKTEAKSESAAPATPCGGSCACH